MGHGGGHHQHLACVAEMLLAAHGEAAGALQHRHHGVADGIVGADLLTLGEGKQRHADGPVLGQRAADDLARLGLHLTGQRKHGVLLDILNVSHGWLLSTAWPRRAGVRGINAPPAG